MNSSRSLAGLIVACSLALLAPLLRPLFTGQVFVSDDLTWYHLPLRYLYQQALVSGDTVLWTPSIFAGLYLHGEGQVGLFHPFHQLIYRLLPLGIAFNLELIANYVSAFAGTWWFLRRLRFSQVASLFGAMLFAFSGFNLLHYHHINMVAVVAHMPWLLAAADVLIVDQRRQAQTLAFAAMAVILGSGFLLGFPQSVWWSAAALAAFALFRAGETRRWRQLLPCAAAVGLGVLLGGVQWLPTADAAAHSMRAGVGPEFSLLYSLHPYNLFQLWSPYFFEQGAYSERETMLFHEFGIYSGAILPIALIWVWSRRHALPERRTLIVAVTACAAIALILALGRYGGLAWLLSYLPVLGSFRAPVRYIVLVQFALAILAAVTIDDLLAIAEGRAVAPIRPMAALWLPAALGIATTLALNTGLLPYGRHTFAPALSAAPGVALVVAVTLSVYLAGRQVRWALGALLVLTAVDLGAWGLGFIDRKPPRTIRSLTATVPQAPGNPADSYAYAPEWGPYRSDLLVMRGYRLTSGYVGLFPATRHAFDTDTSMRLSGTRWIFSAEGSRQLAEGGAARVRLLDDQERGASGRARLLVDRPGHLVAHLEAPGPRTLAFTERFHDGWTGTIDGTPVQVARVEGDFLGVVVGAGIHRVDLRFTPRSFKYGSMVSAFGVAVLAVVLLVRPR